MPRRSVGSRWMRVANTERSAQSRRGVGFVLAEHGELMTQHEELDVLG